MVPERLIIGVRTITRREALGDGYFSRDEAKKSTRLSNQAHRSQIELDGEPLAFAQRTRSEQIV